MINLKSGLVTTERRAADVSEPTTYSYNIDTGIVTELVNRLYGAGLFDLEEEYSTEDTVPDGGRWSLTVTYADGTTRVSAGDSASKPMEVLSEAGMEYFVLTGKEFFSVISDLYRTPPTLYLEYSDGTTDRTMTLEPYKYIWHHNSTEIRGFAEEARLNKPYSFKEGKDYSITASVLDESKYTGLPKDTYRYSQATVISYNSDGGDMRQETTASRGKDIKLVPELGRIYVVRLEFEYGECEYAFFAEAK